MYLEENAKGIDYQGRHYSTYEATQMQRKIERTIRKQKNRILVDEATGDAEKLQTDQIRLIRLNEEYKRFSKAVDIPLQRERAEVAGFGVKQASDANSEYKRVAKAANSMYNKENERDNVNAWLRDKPIRDEIRAHPEKLIINPEKQARHIKGGEGYIPGRSYVTVDNSELQGIVNQYAGTGEIQRSEKGLFINKEIITVDHQIGVSINPKTLHGTPTNRACIHYSKTGTHIVPTAKEV